MIKKTIFPVGGLGTRFLPATKSIPKEMLPIANKPLIQHAFEEAASAGCDQFIFVTGRNKNAIANHFDHSYELERVLTQKQKEEELRLTKGWLPSAGTISFLRQQTPLGLGHAVWCARHFVAQEPFLVTLADEMILKPPSESISTINAMIELYIKKRQEGELANIIAVDEISPSETNKYGIIAYDSQNHFHVNHDMIEYFSVIQMVEKPTPAKAPSNLSITGRYILNPEIMDILSRQKLGAGDEIQLTDGMNDLLKSQKFYAVKIRGKRFDCGNVLGYLDANIAFALADDSIHDGVQQVLKRYLCAVQVNSHIKLSEQ